MSTYIGHLVNTPDGIRGELRDRMGSVIELHGRCEGERVILTGHVRVAEWLRMEQDECEYESTPSR